MRRAPKTCTNVDCPNAQPCPDHAPKPWASKKGHGNRMKSGSREQRINKAVMEKYEGRCHVCGHLGADQVDHVIPLAEGGPDTFENRRPIHAEPCHKAKSAEERERGRRRAAA